MKWKVVLFLEELATLCSELTHCGGGSVCPVSERRTAGCVGESWSSGNCCPRPTGGHHRSGSGEFRDGLEDYIPSRPYWAPQGRPAQPISSRGGSAPERPLPRVWLAPTLEECRCLFLSRNAAGEQRFHMLHGGEMIARMDRLLVLCTVLRGFIAWRSDCQQLEAT